MKVSYTNDQLIYFPFPNLAKEAVNMFFMPLKDLVAKYFLMAGRSLTLRWKSWRFWNVPRHVGSSSK